ncbi:rhamnogalacturonan acetylesterase [Rufibacter soli]
MLGSPHFRTKSVLVLTVLLCFLLAFTKKEKPAIWLIGDSTMAWKKPERDPESGWGEGLKKVVNPKAVVHNHAASGRSARSFVSEKRWAAVLDSIQPGDYVIIQFGHNDQKQDDPKLYTDPSSSYKEFLQKFIDETLARKGIPVMCTPIVRRHFDGTGKLVDTHGEYLNAARAVARENKVGLVDLEAKSRELVAALGPERSKSLYVFCAPKECRRSSKGVQDSTHLNHQGALQIAQLFAADVKKQKLPLRRLLQ